MDINDGQNEASSHLCLACKTLDFEEIFSTREIPATGTEIITIGKAPSDPDSIICDLCRFFHQIKPNYIRNHSHHVRLFDHIAPPSRSITQDELESPRSRFLSVLRKNSRLRYDYQIVDEVRQRGVVGYLRDTDGQASEIRAIDANVVDYQSICHQIDHCSTQHPLCATYNEDPPRADSSSGRLIPDLLIDCIQEKIVRRKRGDRYMTLSYVWGNRGDVETPAVDAFSLTSAPRTIRDAVQVVRNLGRRYLWVDRYCIDQMSHSSKSFMIQHMDIIYELSEATIVALHGQDDDSGLPGVSSVSRIRQPRYQAGRDSLISSGPPIRTLIESSKWNTRAWTYQEARLSQRCLFFSESQVYFVCNQDTWSEAVPFGPSRSSLTRLLNSQPLDAALFGSNTSIPAGYFYDRLEYSKRNLSYDSDILDGFRGVLRRSSFAIYWGIPFTLRNSSVDANIGLALGLLWMRRPQWTISSHIQTAWRRRSSRRPGFPTWSWASLVADIYQDNYGPQSKYGQYVSGRAVDFPQNEARVQFWLSFRGVGKVRADQIDTDNVTTFAEDSRQLLVEGDLVQLAYRYRGPQHRWYLLCGRWIYFQPDVFDEDQTWPGESSEDDLRAEDQVLVLIQWNDAQRSSFRRLLLMVVDWIDETRAERRGLLTAYRHEFRAQDIRELPRIRKRFQLE